MAQVRSWAGLDVHARSVLAVTVDGVSGEMRSRRLSGTTSEVVAFCASLPGPTRAAYEAGPTGYGLARALGGFATERLEDLLAKSGPGRCRGLRNADKGDQLGYLRVGNRCLRLGG